MIAQSLVIIPEAPKIQTFGIYQPGNRVRVIRDLSRMRNKVIASIYEEPYPLLGKVYLIDTTTDNLKGRPFRITLFGFTMGEDRLGFPEDFSANFFGDQMVNRKKWEDFVNEQIRNDAEFY